MPTSRRSFAYDFRDIFLFHTNPQAALISYAILASTQGSTADMITTEDVSELGQANRREASVQSAVQAGSSVWPLPVRGTTEESSSPRPDGPVLAESEASPPPLTQSNSQTNSRISRCLPGSVYLWACGERGKNEDDTSPPSRSEAVAAWVVLMVRKVQMRRSLSNWVGSRNFFRVWDAIDHLRSPQPLDSICEEIHDTY